MSPLEKKNKSLMEIDSSIRIKIKNQKSRENRRYISTTEKALEVIPKSNIEIGDMYLEPYGNEILNSILTKPKNTDSSEPMKPAVIGKFNEKRISVGAHDTSKHTQASGPNSYLEAISRGNKRSQIYKKGIKIQTKLNGRTGSMGNIEHGVISKITSRKSSGANSRNIQTRSTMKEMSQGSRGASRNSQKSK